MSLNRRQKEHAAFSRLISGGMSAVVMATVIQLLQLSNLTLSLKIALICFAIALPFLVLCFTEYAIDPQAEVVESRRWADFLFFSSFIAVVGVAFIFFHLSYIAGIIFAISVVTCIIIAFLPSS